MKEFYSHFVLLGLFFIFVEVKMGNDTDTANINLLRQRLMDGLKRKGLDPILKGPNESELSPDDEVRYLILTFGEEIKTRTEKLINVADTSQVEELHQAEMHALGFISNKETKDSTRFLYFIRLIIGKTFIFHVKISVEKSSSTGLFGLDGKHAEPKNKDRFTLMRVLGPKREEDKIDPSELA